MASIPGVNVSDSDLGEWRRVQDAAPKNPNIGADGLSNDGRNWLGARMGPPAPTAGAPAPAPTLRANPGEWGRQLGTRAGPALRTAGRVASGVGNIMAIDKAVESAMDLDRGDTAAGLKHGLDAVMATTSLPVAGAYGAGNLVGGQLYDRAIAPNRDLADKIGGTINQGVRNLGQVFGQDWGVDDSAYLAQRGPFKEPAARPVAQPAVATQPGAAGPASPAAPAVAAPPAADPGAVYRVTGADGRPTFTNDPSAGGVRMNLPQLNTMPGSAMASGTPSVDAALAGARQAAADRGDWGSVAGSYGAAQPVSTAAAGIRGSVVDDLVAKNSAVDPSQIRSLALQNMDRAGSSKARNEALRVFAQAGDAGAPERIAQAQQAAETTRAIAGLRQRQAEASMNRDVALRGQDVSLAGHRMNNQVAINNMLREQYNADRTFKAGEEQRGFERKQAADNQLTKNLEAAFPGEDGKPDAAAVGMYRQGIERSLARMGANGVDQLTPLDTQRLVAGSQLLDVMRKNSGILPWKPDQLRTVDPVDLVGLRVLPNGDRQITRADSKAVGQIIPRRFFETEQGTRLGTLTGTATNRYDILSEGRQ